MSDEPSAPLSKLDVLRELEQLMRKRKSEGADKEEIDGYIAAWRSQFAAIRAAVAQENGVLQAVRHADGSVTLKRAD